MKIEARVGGDGVTAPRLVSTSAADSAAMIDRFLADHPEGVMFVEVKRDDPRSWDEWKDDLEDIEYMHVGMAGDWAAAQYVRGGFRAKLDIASVRATHNRTPKTEPVPYDEVLKWYFPPETVISREQVRRLMIHYATTGEWLDEIPSRNHDYLVR
ncbi:Imm1 family immunity protein [Labedaea rhizosphaerae]|uniref:Immunity protein Imm1 of predicted polymorphic toxin system n=1 Tax=Labedaea rhizosphaerae TaxID=598644 RepID=A0A4V3D049_LABRH|nr:Imm1 family immunity protein [Labedaea rhizosphaerae]TDQ04405.1 immunity protein Imm1 of predicted polymorphic toxin system [Labedaea rhizosphaerae]